MFTSKIRRHTRSLLGADISQSTRYNCKQMYLRTVTRKNKNGTSVDYYQLAHNERDPKSKKPVARIIHSFGRADRLDRNVLVRLCQSIARVCGLKVIDISQQWEQEKSEQ